MIQMLLIIGLVKLFMSVLDPKLESVYLCMYIHASNPLNRVTELLSPYTYLR